jgi:LPS O-antigen subunit length determinant protein (WzzB/FepE family)
VKKAVGDEKKVDAIVEKKQERDWRMDEDFKKFMGNPSIEAALKIEKKRAEEKLRELDSQEQGNLFKGLLNKVLR